MKRYKRSDRHYWNQYCKSLTGYYPDSDNAQHLSVSVSGEGKVDNVVFVVTQPVPVAPAHPEDAAVETATKQQPAAATSQSTAGKKGGNIWKWCLGAGLLAGAVILGRHLWKSNRAA
ncbi:MAG: hypothetical protein IKW89_02490 [Bacteroidales bacterium]|nr:hypothetical protein [Bacteroidales bacterium]